MYKRQVLAPAALTAVAPATTPPSSTATSAPFTVTSPGTVRFLASYSGDAFYAPIPNTPCGAPGENITVPRSTPGLVTVASAGTVGGEVTDTATLSGGFNPTGTIRFDLYNNETCTGPPVFTDTVTVNGNGDYTTRPFILPAAGIYHFVATYSGDANNNPVGPTDCLDPLETVGVGVLAVNVTTVASGPVNVGQPIFDTATLSGGFNPTGVLAFRLFGPDNDDCSGAPIFISNRTVTGNGNYTSESFTPTQPGTYRWVAVYSGDANHARAETACDDPLEQVVVSPVPTITIVKTASPPSLPVPGGVFTFDLLVTNTSNVPLRITSLTDDIYGDVTTIPGSTCATAVGTVLAPSPGPGNTYACRFTGLFNGPAGASQTDVATVTAVDERGNTVTDDDDAVVTITPLPTIAIVKTATPLSLPVPGGTFNFDLVVTNTSGVPLTITTLTDDIYGDVTRIPGSTCSNAIGVVLAPTPGPGNTYSCRFPGQFTGPAGASQTDVATVTAVDERGNTVRDDDDAVVTITPVPTITTTKTPNPVSLPEPGGTFTFTYTVTNTGPEPVTITSIVDDIYGDLNGRGTCAIGARLATGQTYTCAFSGNFFGNAGAAQTDTITTTGRDDRGQQVVSRTQATVHITDVPPSIRIVKTADPLSRPEPGGIFRFTVVVTNTSFEPITTVSLVDDIYGDLNGRGSCAIGIVLAANGGSYSCAFDGEFRGRAGDSQTDTVTVVAVDDDGTRVTATAKAIVTITPVTVPPVVQPPPPPPVVVQTPPQVLVRTGSSLAGPARMAGFLLLVGMTLIAATHRFGAGGAQLAPIPLGPGPRGGGRRRGGGGPGGDGRSWFGDDGWFGGARVERPRPSKGGGGAGVMEPPPLPPVEELNWDEWVGGRPRPALDPGPDAGAAEHEQAVHEPAPVVLEPVVVTPQPVDEHPEVMVEAAAATVVPETLVPTVVQVRSTGALDAAALDAAEAAPAERRPQGPPRGGGRSGRFGRR